MSFALLVWLSLFAILSVLAFVRPIYGVALYMLSFFACPTYWWWGKLEIGGYRWNLLAGIILLAAVAVNRIVSPAGARYADESPRVKLVCWLAVAIVANATFVHYVLAPNRNVSALSYDLLAKFVLLFFMTIASPRSVADLRLMLLAILIGAGYIGYEATINHRGKMHANRLEGIGAPGAGSANDLANLFITIMPLAGVFLFSNRRWEKLVVLPIGGFFINVILLCNSRGGFLATIVAGIAFLATVPAKERKKALCVLALGAFAAYWLMGDERIISRFMTTFVGDEERDYSASSRLDYWKAGLRMIADHPLGAGGKGFDRVYGPRYIHEVSGAEFEARSVHNGYINEMCEWGIQGGILRMAFLMATMVLMFETSRRCSRNADTMGSLLGAALISGTMGYLFSCLFGSFMDAEWGFWMPALAVAYGRFYAEKRPVPTPQAETEWAPPEGIYGWPAYGSLPAPRDRARLRLEQARAGAASPTAADRAASG